MCEECGGLGWVWQKPLEIAHRDAYGGVERREKITVGRWTPCNRLHRFPHAHVSREWSEAFLAQVQTTPTGRTIDV